MQFRKSLERLSVLLGVLALAGGGAYAAEVTPVSDYGVSEPVDAIGHGESCTIGERQPPVLKWLQLPDLDDTGLDVHAQYPPGPGVVLADDFSCDQTGPLTEIHVWGSWLYDEYPIDPSNVTFVLSIHTNDPAGPAGWSVPVNPPLWTRTFSPAEFTAQVYASDLVEGWYDPSTGWYEPFADTMCWEYIFFVPAGQEFIQQGAPGSPVIYWLDIQAFPEYESYFGWKTTEPPFQWNDDAVWAEGSDPPAGPWWEMFYPGGHPWEGASLDLAFAIYGYEDPPGACCCYGTCGETTESDCGTGCVWAGGYTQCSGAAEACCVGSLLSCSNMDPVCCPVMPGIPQGPGTWCTGAEACCLPITASPDCSDVDPICCDELGGFVSGLGDPFCLGDGSGNGRDDACEQDCEPNPDGTACLDVICTDPADQCAARCINYDPATGQSVVIDCECRDPSECHAEEAVTTRQDPCVVPDNGTGTITLPPLGCEYLSPDEVHMIIDGLPPGTTIELAPIHLDFICEEGPCSILLPPGECEAPGGTLGGHGDCFWSTLDLTVSGTGDLTGFNRHLWVPLFCEVHTGPRNPGDPVQTFPNDMYRLQGQLYGDPDFCTFQVTAGTDFGLPGPGQTTLTELPSGDFAVDSFFDITYQIEFVGCAGSVLEGYAGTTTAVIRMQTETPQPPTCVGGCDAGEVCEETWLPNADGTIDICCDCVPDVCAPLPDGSACNGASCEVAGDVCVARCLQYDSVTGYTTYVDCECREPSECQAEPGPPVADPCIVDDNGTGTITLPPIGCDYISPNDVHLIIEGLPPGTTIELDPIHMDFLCPSTGVGICTLPIPPGECEVAGGSLGGHGDCFESTLDLTVRGTGELTGFNRHLAVPIACEVHTGPRNPGDPVQSFVNDMYRLTGELFGDPDFCEFIVTAGTDFGLPGPGQTTLTDLGDGTFNVDSFFDITYQIQFQGCPGSLLYGYAGTTTATIRMETGGPQAPPTCVGDCPLGEVCEQSVTDNGDGTADYCCDCVQAPCEPTPDGSQCQPAQECIDLGETCMPHCANVDASSGAAIITDCECRADGECYLEIPPPVANPNPCVVEDNGHGTITLPPEGCQYLSPAEVHEIIEGLPPGTTIELDAIHEDFVNVDVSPGGSLGGEIEWFESTLDLTVTGTGDLAGFNRHLAVPIDCEVHTGPRNPGDPVQSFANDMFRLTGELFGDPDFCALRVTGGTDYGLPGPGHTTLIDLGDGTYHVDSFFDITYQIEFAGCPDSVLADYMGTTTATIRMETGIDLPTCAGGCDPGYACYQTVIGDGAGSLDVCCDCVPDVCEPEPDGSGCMSLGCPAVGEECEQRCMRYDTTTGDTTVVECACREPGQCVAQAGAPVTSPCYVEDNGTGTITLPPIGCDYLSPNEVHMIIDGLPPGTTIELDPIHMDFVCPDPANPVCTMPLAGGECETTGGSLGGHGDCFESTLDLTVTGTGSLAGFNRHLAVPIFCEVHTGPRNPGDPVQSFDTDMYRLTGELFGDPDFCEFIVTGGTDFGLPGPGHTTLIEQPGGDYAVDSFFDITYQIEFEGCPDSELADYAGTTTATIRMETGGIPEPPLCLDGCPTGYVCEQSVTDNGDGTADYCCDCVQLECAPTADGSACEPAICPDPTDICTPRCMQFNVGTGDTLVVDCECREPDECFVIPLPIDNPCVVEDNGTGTVTLPPIGCEYLSPYEVHQIIDGLPPGTTIELDPIHMDFICPDPVSPYCTMPLGPGECETTGGSLGGHGDCFESTLDLTVTGTGELAGFNRHLAVPIFCEVHTGPRNPGDAVQTFPNEMYRLVGELFGDPDFCELRVTGGSDFGLPGPGQTRLTQLPSGDFAVDSFFDITYQIEFEGCLASVLEDYAGTTTATIRMETGYLDPPVCAGDCPEDLVCERSATDNGDGTVDFCCDCVPYEPPGACCYGTPSASCVETTEDDCTQVYFGTFGGAGTTCGGVEGCCQSGGTCLDADAFCCANVLAGTAQGSGSACSGVTVACCLNGGIDCAETDRLCCDDEAGTESPWGSSACLGDNNGNTIDDACEQECQPWPDGSGCLPVECPDPVTETCLPRCANYDPDTWETTVIECACVRPDYCHLDNSAAATVACIQQGAELPPLECPYVSPAEVHEIIDGLPPGTTIELNATHAGFGNVVRTPGGSLGGEIEEFDSSLALEVAGTGTLAGFNRFLMVPLACETHIGPRDMGAPVQEFPNDMFRLTGELFGDPDFCELRITGGSDYGLPGPGFTKLTQLPGGEFAVDSFFDITYQIEFEGCAGSILDGYMGITTATIRMRTPRTPPTCTGDCPPDETCAETLTANPDGTFDICCECVQIGTPHPAPYPDNRQRNRYIQFDPNPINTGVNVAFKVTLTSLRLSSCDDSGSPDVEGWACRTDGDCRACSDVVPPPNDPPIIPCWTTPLHCPPGETCDLTGAHCVNDQAGSVGMVWWVGEEHPTTGVHLLVTQPFRKESTAWPNPILVGDCEIVPVAVYEVRAVDVGTSVETPPLEVKTVEKPDRFWADCVAPLGDHCTGNWRPCSGDADCPVCYNWLLGPTDPNNGSSLTPCTTDADCDPATTGEFCGSTCILQWPPPDGFINFQDVNAAVFTFSGLPTVTATDVANVDLHGGQCSNAAVDPPNYVVNFVDIDLMVKAFAGWPYPYSDPGDCPDVCCWSSCPGPTIGEYSNSGCLGGGPRDQDPDAPCVEPDRFVFTPGPGMLHVLHENATYNCCPDDILIGASFDGIMLRLRETEVLTNPCYCMCCYNVQATVVELGPGEYTVELCWFDWETDGELCHVETVVIP